jgi:hypothetical protein
MPSFLDCRGKFTTFRQALLSPALQYCYQEKYFFHSVLSDVIPSSSLSSALTTRGFKHFPFCYAVTIGQAVKCQRGPSADVGAYTPLSIAIFAGELSLGSIFLLPLCCCLCHVGFNSYAVTVSHPLRYNNDGNKLPMHFHVAY